MSNKSSLSFAKVPLLVSLVILFATAELGTVLAFQNAANAERELEPLNRYPHMVQEYFVDQLRRVEAKADRRRNLLSTRADAEAYVRSVRARIQDSFGPWPAKTPLNPSITGVIERDGYIIEKLLFESRPNFFVTANLYIPKGRKFPLPGVVGTCGHSSNGKASEFYQSFAQGLARQGYVVILYDPISQGERLQYTNDQLESEFGPGVREHLHAGNQQFLVGEFIGSWRAWDGIRALDYLLTREEVDPNHRGVTGNSGGGTMTTWLAGVDQRWSMAAPSCFVTTFRRNLENELPADTEQCPPRALELGLDHSDFLAAMAPKPVIILAKEKDYFDVRGSEESFRRLRNLYSLLGAEESVEIFVGPTMHGYSEENRTAMYRWFNRATKISNLQKEPALIIEDDATLNCAPRGQVVELNSKPIYDFTAEKSRALAKGRSRDIPLKQLQKSIQKTLRITDTKNPSSPYYRIMRTWSGRDFPKPQWTTYLVETEPGISAVVYRLGDERLQSRPHVKSQRAVLYIAHTSSDEELRQEELITELIEEDSATLYTVDVRGIGESRPDTTNEDAFYKPYGSDYFYAIHSIMLGRPYIGQRTYDVLRVVDWLSSIGHTEIHLVGKGWGSVPAAFAGVLSEHVTQLTLKNPPTSYSEIAESRTYNWPLALLVPGILESFDLPDCYRVLQKKHLRLIEPWGPNSEPF
jgi:dienelactone hydrolase/pimeloyl-ACP methyl ester carboxylesterase